MLSSFTGAFSKLKQTKIAQKVSSNYQKLKNQINKKIQIVEVFPRLYHISYPQQDTLRDLKSHVGNEDYQIWNISEYKYSKQFEKKILEQAENAQIHHLCFEYYSNLPLYELIIAINSIHYFLEISENHKIYLHCQDNKLRSSLFLACFIYKFKIMKISDVSEAILFVNQKLSTNLQVQQKESETSNYKNQHIFFKNFINYLNSPQIINPNKLELLKIIVSDAPSLKILKDEIGKGNSLTQLKVYIEIRSKQQVVLKATYDNSVFEGDSICIVLSNRTIILGDDFLVMIKYIYQGKVYGMMRIQLNTNFIFDRFFRAHQQLLDLSTFCLVQEKSTMFVDFMFEDNLSHSDLARLHDMPENQVRTLSKKQQKYEDKKQLETKESEELKAQISAQNFSLDDHELEDQHEVDENEINRKIEEVMKNINNKPVDSSEQDERESEEEEKEEEEEDLDDYLSKLQQKA